MSRPKLPPEELRRREIEQMRRYRQSHPNYWIKWHKREMARRREERKESEKLFMAAHASRMELWNQKNS